MAPVKQTDWSTFEPFVVRWIPRHTVIILKTFVTILNVYDLSSSLSVKSGERKADIISKIQAAFYELKIRNDLETYIDCRYRCECASDISAGGAGSSTVARTASTSAGTGMGFSGYGTGGGFGAAGGGGIGVDRWKPAAGPSTNGPTFGAAPSSYPPARANPGPQYTLHDWSPSPLWKPIRALSAMESLPDISASESHTTYRSKRTNLIIPPDVCEKIKHCRSNPNTKPTYSLRLFATSSDHYRLPSGMYRPPPSVRLPIEWPVNPEVSIDGTVLPFKEKGLRGKAGSAPPLDLDKGPRQVECVPGRVTAVGVGHRGPTVGKLKVSKRFFYQIVLCEITSKEDLLKVLLDLAPTSAEAALADWKKKQAEDEDIVAGRSKLSLKDPLSYMRITKPIRSTKCSHLQCFDATWWIESNSVHPQWLCPLCSKVLNQADLICDGYVLGILEACPADVDDVVLEASGEWHTEDGQYGSVEWMRGRPPPPPKVEAEVKQEQPGSRTETPGTSAPPVLPPDSAPASGSGFDSGPVSGSGTNAQKRKIVELFDSDDEDSSAHSHPRAPSHAPATNTNTNALYLPRPNVSRNGSAAPSTTGGGGWNGGVIDLTLSDSEDDEPPPRPSPSVNASASAYNTNSHSNGNGKDYGGSAGGGQDILERDRLGSTALRTTASTSRSSPLGPQTPLTHPPQPPQPRQPHQIPHTPQTSQTSVNGGMGTVMPSQSQMAARTGAPPGSPNPRTSLDLRTSLGPGLGPGSRAKSWARPGSSVPPPTGSTSTSALGPGPGPGPGPRHGTTTSATTLEDAELAKLHAQARQILEATNYPAGPTLRGPPVSSSSSSRSGRGYLNSRPLTPPTPPTPPNPPPGNTTGNGHGISASRERTLLLVQREREREREWERRHERDRGTLYVSEQGRMEKERRDRLEARARAGPRAGD